MKESIFFDKCTISHLNQVRDIAESTFINAFAHQNTPEDMQLYVDKAFNLQTVQEEMNNPNSIFYLIKKANQIIGYLKLNVEDAQNEAIQDGIELERIYIKVDFQGQGFGKLMVEKVFEIAKELNKTTVWLGVWDKNFDAIRFYERFGFKIFSEHSFFLGTDQQMDYLMKVAVI